MFKGLFSLKMMEFGAFRGSFEESSIGKQTFDPPNLMNGMVSVELPCYFNVHNACDCNGMDNLSITCSNDLSKRSCQDSRSRNHDRTRSRDLLRGTKNFLKIFT